MQNSSFLKSSALVAPLDLSANALHGITFNNDKILASLTAPQIINMFVFLEMYLQALVLLLVQVTPDSVTMRFCVGM
jgi:hypothetical protein